MTDIDIPAGSDLYVETDFLLALIKGDDWLGKPAERLYEQYQGSMWTTRDTLVELMLVAYREDWHVPGIVANANQAVAIRGETEAIIVAATYVQDDGFTPFDALHLVHSNGSPIVSSDDSYDGYSERVALDEFVDK